MPMIPRKDFTTATHFAFLFIPNIALLGFTTLLKFVTYIQYFIHIPGGLLLHAWQHM